EQSNKVGEAGEEWLHKSCREHARGDELAAWVGAHSAHGIDLFRDKHRTELGGDAGGAATGDEDAGECWAEFGDKSDRYDVAGKHRLAEARKLRAGLENHNDANEKAGEKDDGKGADTDVVHLLEEVLEVVRAAEEVREGTGGEEGVILNVGDELQ